MSAETLKQDKQLWEVRSEILPLLLNSPHLDLLIKIKDALHAAAKLETQSEPAVKRLTRKEFDAEIMESLEDIKNGDVLSFDEFVKEADSWG